MIDTLLYTLIVVQISLPRVRKLWRREILLIPVMLTLDIELLLVSHFMITDHQISASSDVSYHPQYHVTGEK